MSSLSTRRGPRPSTTPWAPHIQKDQLAPPEWQHELQRRVFALPDVEERDCSVAHPAERAIWLRDEVAVADPDMFLGNREIGHFRPWDGSLPRWLASPVSRAVPTSSSEPAGPSSRTPHATWHRQNRRSIRASID